MTSVDREDRAGGPELRAHVADGGPVGERHLGHALAVELDELADDAVVAQHLGDGQDDVGRGRAGRDRPREPEAHDTRDEHRHGLAEHGRLGLDAPDAPAEDAEAVDHRRVRVGADARVGVGHPSTIRVAGHDDARQVLDVDLVDDAGARRHDLEVVERGLAPAEELVALVVALVLDLDVPLERVGAPEDVDDDRVVDDQLGGREGVDLGGVTTEIGDGLAHRRQVDDAWHASEVLHDDARRGELDLRVGLGVGVPAAQSTDVVSRDVGPVLGPQQVLQENLEAVRESVVSLDLSEAVDLVRLTPDLEGPLGLEAVNTAHSGLLPATEVGCRYRPFILISRYLTTRPDHCQPGSPTRPRDGQPYAAGLAPPSTHPSQVGGLHPRPILSRRVRARRCTRRGASSGRHPRPPRARAATRGPRLS